MRRAGLLITIILATLSLGRDVCAQKPTESSEYEIKAGYIYNFPKYVEWPAAARGSVDAPIIIGVLGDDSFADALSDIVAGKKLSERKLVVRKLKWSKEPKELKDCTMVYVAASEAAHGDDVIQLLKGSPILTIGDFRDFAKHGGIINFFLENNNVRFEANVEAAKQSDLTISSQMLIRAKIVATGLSWR
jgi:hypothetical protein